MPTDYTLPTCVYLISYYLIGVAVLLDNTSSYQRCPMLVFQERPCLILAHGDGLVHWWHSIWPAKTWQVPSHSVLSLDKCVSCPTILTLHEISFVHHGNAARRAGLNCEAPMWYRAGWPSTSCWIWSFSQRFCWTHNLHVVQRIWKVLTYIGCQKVCGKKLGVRHIPVVGVGIEGGKIRKSTLLATKPLLICSIGGKHSTAEWHC